MNSYYVSAILVDGFYRGVFNLKHHQCRMWNKMYEKEQVSTSNEERGTRSD